MKHVIVSSLYHRFLKSLRVANAYGGLMRISKLILKFAALATIAWIPATQAVLISPGDGTQNTTTPAGAPSWYNVGRLSIGGGVYIGNGWVLTAAHLDPGTNHSITFYTNTGLPNDGFPGSGTTYQLDTTPAGFHRLTNPDSTSTDLVLTRTLTDPGLPSLTIATATPGNGTGILLEGLGVNRGAAVQYNAAFIEVPSGGTYSGFKFVPNDNEFGRVSKRWGTSATTPFGASTTKVENNIQNASFTTVFGSTFRSPTNSPTSSEAIGISGDSGGAIFSSTSPNTLLGIMLYQTTFANQPAGSALYGNGTEAANLATYAAQIQSIVSTPEPVTGLVLLGGLGMLLRRTRRTLIR